MFKAIIDFSPRNEAEPPLTRTWAWQRHHTGLWARGTTETSYWRNPRLFVLAEGRLDEPASPDQLAKIVADAYQLDRSDFVQRFQGEFAFLIWDEQRSVALLGRDHFGICTICYTQTAGRLAVASDAYLLRGTFARDELNEMRVADYLMGVPSPPSATFFRGVFAVPPAHTLRVGLGALTVQPYWTPAVESPPNDHVGHAKRLRELLATAVHRRISYAERPGIALSAGLDSGAIATVLPPKATPYPAFTMTYPSTPTSDEWSEVSSGYGANGRLALHPIGEAELSTLETNASLLLLPDGPSLEPSVLVHTTLLRKASAAGIDLLFDGLDGNGVIWHGQGRLAELLSRARWLSWYREASAISRRRDVPMSRLVLAQIQHALPRLHREARRRAHVLAPSFRKHVDAYRRAKTAMSSSTARGSAQQHHEQLISPYYPAGLSPMRQVERQLDIASAHPFLDVALVKHCLATPPNWQLHDGWARWIQRVAFENELPTQVCWRQKKVPLKRAVWFAMLKMNYSAFRDGALSPTSPLRDLVDPHILSTAWQEMIARPALRAMRTVWRATLLARWLSVHATFRGAL